MVASRTLTWWWTVAAVASVGWAYHDAEKCLEAGTTAEIGTCFTGLQDSLYGACFNDTSIATFETCMDASAEAEPWECGGVMMCAYDTFLAEGVAVTSDLNSCVVDAAKAFLQWGIANLAAGRTACGAVYSEDTLSLFGTDLTAAAVATCDAFQTNFANAACTPTSCCSTCQPQLDAVLECVSNDIYGLDCDLTCQGGDVSASGTRARSLQKIRQTLARRSANSASAVDASSSNGRRLEEEEEETLDMHVSAECPSNLVNSTTLDKLTDTPALYLDCVALHYLWMFTDEGVEYVMGGDDGSENHNGTTTDGSGGEGTGTTDGSGGEGTGTTDGTGGTDGAGSTNTSGAPGLLHSLASLMSLVLVFSLH